MRILLAAVVSGAVLAAVATLGPSPARAGYGREGPWCAMMDIGGQTMERDCSFWRLKDCVPYVIAGNRGFCTPNPDFRGPIPGFNAPHRRYHR